MGASMTRSQHYINQSSCVEKLQKIKKMHDKELRYELAKTKALASWIKFIVKDSYLDENSIYKTLYLMGSMSDGNFSARLFAEKIFTFECDVMIPIFNVPVERGSLIKVKPGFYKARSIELVDLNAIATMFQGSPQYAGRLLEIVRTGFRNGFLSGKAIRDLADYVTKYHPGLALEKLVALGRKVDRVFVSSRSVRQINGPAVTLETEINIYGKHFITASFDIVVCIRLLFWPEEADPWWMSRERKWPPQKVVMEILDAHDVYLVAKPSSELDQEAAAELRLTFAGEKRLIAEQTEEIRFTYYIFKILFYKYFKAEVGGKTLPSYLAKTVMFWQCEKVERGTWRKQSIQHNLQMLLERLFDGLQKKQIPNYFVPEINLVANVSNELIRKALQTCDREGLISDPVGCLPGVTETVINRFDFLEQMANNWDVQFKDWELDRYIRGATIR